jgi:hypothetical protein
MWQSMLKVQCNAGTSKISYETPVFYERGLGWDGEPRYSYMNICLHVDEITLYVSSTQSPGSE